MSQAAADFEEFRAFERAAWSARASAYDRFFAPISAHLTEPLLDAAHVEAGKRVLDLATGPGYVAKRAAMRGADVLGTDFSADMVRLASASYPGLLFQHADAEHLPFPDFAFDAVLANLLLPHLADPNGAMREAVRVLAPGGMLATTVWDVPARSRLMGIIVDAVEEAGAAAPGLPPSPSTFLYADDAAFRSLLEEAGLIDVTITAIAFTHHLPSADAYWDGMLEATVRAAALVLTQQPEVQAHIRAVADRLLLPYATSDGFAIPISIKLAAGRRPD